MNNDLLFTILRDLTIFFATLMLIKYYIFLVVSPFHTVKENLRKLRLLRHNPEYEPEISVIIPAWNEEIGIIPTLRSILRNTYQKKEIIIVNDGSTDKLHEKVREFSLSQEYKSEFSHIPVQYFQKENQGKGTALNHGIKVAKGEIIVTIDADSVLQKNALKNLVSYFADPNIDAAVGQVKIARSKTVIGLLQQLEYIFGFYYKRAHSVLGAEYIFGGACAAFRKEKTFDKLGLFDIATKTEDIEMSLRIRYHGLRCVYAENVICHTEGASKISGLLNQRLRWKKGRFDTFVKYRSMFFSFDPKHNRALSWFILPFALLSEIQLLFEPIGITLLASYSVITGDFISLAIGVLFIFIIYFVTSIFSHQGLDVKKILLFPLIWPFFYIIVWVEYLALLKSLSMLFRGKNIEWQKWQREGVKI